MLACAVLGLHIGCAVLACAVLAYKRQSCAVLLDYSTKFKTPDECMGSCRSDEMLPFRVGSNTIPMRVKSNHLDGRSMAKLVSTTIKNWRGVHKIKDCAIDEQTDKNTYGKAKDRDK